MVEKVQNESSNTESSHTIEVKNKENKYQKKDKPVSVNQLMDWQSRQNNVSVYKKFLRQTLSIVVSIVTTPQQICYQSLNN